MAAEPEHPHFVWTGCPHATPDGFGTNGKPHWVCQSCEWALNTSPTVTKKKGKTK